MNDDLNQKNQWENLKTYKSLDTDKRKINHIADIDFSRTCSYADYFRWGFEERPELIKGKMFRIGPAPSLTHQWLCEFIYVKLYAYLSGKTCEAFISPIDVRLPLFL